MNAGTDLAPDGECSSLKHLAFDAAAFVAAIEADGTRFHVYWDGFNRCRVLYADFPDKADSLDGADLPHRQAFRDGGTEAREAVKQYVADR